MARAVARAAPGGGRHRRAGADRAGLRGRRHARGHAAVGGRGGPRACWRRACASAGDWLAVGLDARPERLRDYPWRSAPPPTLDELVARAGGGRRAPLRLLARARRRRRAARRRAWPAAWTRTSWWQAASSASMSSGRCAMRASAGVILGEALFTGRIDLGGGAASGRLSIRAMPHGRCRSLLRNLQPCSLHNGLEFGELAAVVSGACCLTALLT